MELTKEQIESRNKDNWNEYWCNRCRSIVGKENLPIEFDVIIKNIKTGKIKVIDRVCINCVKNIKYHE